MLRSILASALLVLALSPFSFGRQNGDGASGAATPPKTPAEVAAMAEKFLPSLVRVEITAQYDKGEAPMSGHWSRFRARAQRGPDEVGSGGWENWETLIREERPAERAGYLVGPTRVYTSDPGLHPRFIKSIQVRFGQQLVKAKLAAWPQNEDGVFLELESGLQGATPLTFDPSKPGPYTTIGYEKHDAAWLVRVGSLRTGVALSDDGRRFVPGNGGALVVDKDGVPVTMTGSGDLPVDGSWKRAISDWPIVSESQFAEAVTRLDAASAKHLLRVTLNFRSPRSAGENRGRRYRGEGDEEAITEWNGLGLLTDERTVLVLANMKPKVTGRLERVRVFSADGAERKATFAGTLKDWGAFVATLESPLPGPAAMASGAITDYRGKLLLKAAVKVRGETRTSHIWQERIESFETSWKGRTFPEMNAGDSQDGEYRNFLYGLDGQLLAVPLEHREKVTVRERYGSDDVFPVPVDILTSVLREGPAAIERENRPVSEEEENRLAWLGAEMQSMDPDLARANNVMDETNGGQSGGIVTYLYPGSPAASAGLKEGDIVLRLHVDGHPKPLEVEIEETPGIGMMEQFWAAIDRVPEEYLDRLPRPWGSAENSLSRALTDLGFGTPFVADIWRDGKLIAVPMTVTQGPAHYDAAARFKSEALGVTARDLTYEVRRYMQLKDDEPGVIMAKVERGSKASVAGLKPYEIIKSVNDEPVNNVKDFERLIASGGELKFAVKRMTQGRTVKVKLDAGPAPAAAGEGAKPAAAGSSDQP